MKLQEFFRWCAVESSEEEVEGHEVCIPENDMEQRVKPVTVGRSGEQRVRSETGGGAAAEGSKSSCAATRRRV